jgi:hypothetical protein
MSTTFCLRQVPVVSDDGLDIVELEFVQSIGQLQKLILAPLTRNYICHFSLLIMGLVFQMNRSIENIDKGVRAIHHCNS